MRKLRTFIECFLTVTTGIVFIAACTYGSQPEALTSMTLWQILLSAALCALSTTLFFPDEYPGKVRFWVGIALHFVSLCVIMIVCGRWFGWVGPKFRDAAIMVGYVVIVYAFTTGISYLLEVKQATNMDRKLQEKYHCTPSDETP
jgi:ABC-type polysaccharide/polyol phosphate export permease